MKPAIQSALIAAMLLTAQPTLFSEEAKPGDRVAAKWTDGGFYLATVVAAQSGKVVVLYDDGDTGTVLPADVKGPLRNTDINAGEPVLAPWKTARMFPGVVTATTAHTVTVRWDDGDTPLEVAKARIATTRRVELESAASRALPVGTSVAAKWGSGSFWIATITSVEADGRYSVKYGDGDTGVVAPGDVEPVESDRELPVGTQVVACWRGAMMYPGTITARDAGTNLYTVKWDDGDAPLQVSRDRIAPLRRPAPAITAGDTLPVGTIVAAKWGSGSFYIATISGIDTTGRYSVAYGDGDKGLVAPGDVLPVSPAREIEVGAHVLACWRGAAMYPGIVTARRENLYTVKWDDGDAPLEVTRDRIALLLPAR
jgi:hypothetical protein